MVQASVVGLLVALVGLGAGGLYTLSSSVSTTTILASTGSGRYLGANLPQGYVVAPLLQNAPSYPCPSSDTSTQCASFKASCGNGVCDPNETCGTCPIDCGVPQGLSCDPFTGRASGLGGICEITIPFTNIPGSGANQYLNQCATPGGCSSSG